MISIYDYRNTLNELVSAINTGDWTKAYTLVERFQSEVESMLVTLYNEPNSVTDHFSVLKLRIMKRMPYNVKAKQVREALSDILNKLSIYGLGVARSDMVTRNERAKILRNLSKRLEETLLEVLIARENRALNTAIFQQKLKETLFILSTLEKTVNDHEDNRLLCIQAKRFVLKKIYEIKAGVMSPDNMNIDSLRTFLDYINGFADMIETDDEYDIESIATYVFELEERVQLDREMKPQKVTGEEGTFVEERKFSPDISARVSEFDWVDEDWEQILQHPRVFLVIGHKGGGKSAFGYALMEYYHKKYGLKAYLVNVSGRPIPPNKIIALPKWISVVNNPTDATNNSVILIDEAYMRFHARRTARAEAPIMDALLELSRQKSQTYIYVTQNTSKIDKNIIASIDAIFVKPTNEFRISFERPELRVITTKAFKLFKKIPESDRKRHVYVFSVNPEYEGMKTNGLPSFWSDELSTFYEGW